MPGGLASSAGTRLIDLWSCVLQVRVLPPELVVAVLVTPVASATWPGPARDHPTIRPRRRAVASPEVKFANGDARRFLVARQLLAPTRSLVGGPDAVLEVLRRLGSIQLDQVDVAGRSHDLVLHVRVADYDPT